MVAPGPSQPSPFYSRSCRFPGCDRAASHVTAGGGDDEAPLCLEHDRMRFYSPAEFARAWEANDPARVRPR